MSETIEVESIRRLDIKPGETLVITLPGSARPEDFERISHVVKSHLPDGVHVLIVNSQVELGVIAADSTT